MGRLIVVSNRVSIPGNGTAGGLAVGVLAALKGMTFQGVAYAAPEAFDAKGDNKAAVIFVNDVDGDRFREIAEIGGAP